MRISELIKELERIKNERGDLLVSIYRSESGDDYSFYPEGNYYSDVNLEVVNNTNTNLKNGIGEIVIINEAYFLGIY